MYLDVREGRPLKSQLAELDDDDSVVSEVLERLLDHLSRVEVALGQHEGAQRGRVVGGVAVGRREPHEVVVRVVTGEVGPAIALVQLHLGPLGQVPGVVREAVLQQRDGHGVELDGLDVTGSEVQRGQDLVATR